MPPIIGRVQGRLRAVLDSLAAVEMVLVQHPVISDHYSANPFLFIMKPLAEHLQGTMDHVKQVRQGLGKRNAERHDRAGCACLEGVRVVHMQVLGPCWACWARAGPAGPGCVTCSHSGWPCTVRP